VTKGPISAGRDMKRTVGDFLGTSRYEAPEEKSSCRATQLRKVFGPEASKAGHNRGFPKKGRGTSDGFRWRDFGSKTRPGRSEDQRRLSGLCAVE
jgi:hypothetical protein